MDPQWKEELAAAIRGLSELIAELKDIAVRLRNDYSGIGTEICADRLEGTVESLEGARNLLTQLQERTPTVYGVEQNGGHRSGGSSF